MLRIIACILLASSTFFAQTPASSPSKDLLKKDVTGLQSSVNEIVSQTVPGVGLLQAAKATYLEGFGLVVSVEAVLEPPRNPFSSPKTPAEVRGLVTERRAQLQQKLGEFLKQRTGALQSVNMSESVAVILHLFNSNPADLPELPSQLVLIVSRQDPTNVRVREF